MDCITIIVPITLVSESNKSEHWSAGAKRHKAQKMAVTAFLRHELEEVPMPCEITLVRHSMRFYDDSNLVSAFKYVQDAVSEFAIPEKAIDKYGKPLAGRADNDPRIKWQYRQEKYDGHCISIEIKPLLSRIGSHQ
jgi:hypothetical protein